jgi:dephospho-CoA kinase
MLEGFGALVFDCDRYVHELYLAHGAGTQAVVTLFGDEILDDRGGVDRTALSRRVLSNPAVRAELEGVIHPLVREGIDCWLASVPSARVAVVEAALLVETGAWAGYDILAVVWCQPEQQRIRALARGLSADRIERFLAAQLPLEDKRSKADVLIDNSGSLAQLELEVLRTWTQITDCCRRST